MCDRHDTDDPVLGIGTTGTVAQYTFWVTDYMAKDSLKSVLLKFVRPVEQPDIFNECLTKKHEYWTKCSTWIPGTLYPVWFQRKEACRFFSDGPLFNFFFL